MEVANLVAKFSADGEQSVMRALGNVDRGITNVADNSVRAGRGLGTVFQVAGGFLGAQLVNFGFNAAKGLVDMQANAEQARISLEVVTGSAERANELFAELQAFAAQTPFAFPELMDSAIALEAFGLKAEDWLTTIGDTASAMGKSVDQVTQAVLDATTGEYERLKELGIKARVEGDKLVFSYMKNGQEITQTVDKNNREVIASTVQGIWNEKYAGAMEKQSKTFAGQMSTLKDNIALTMQNATASVFQFATRGLAFVNDIFADGFSATIEDRFGATGTAVLGFFETIISGAGRAGAALIAAFGEGAPVADLVKNLPPGLQTVGEKLLYVADAAGDLFSAFQSGGFSGLIRQLPQELKQVGEMLLETARGIGTSVVSAIQNTDLSGVGEAAGRFARELIVGIAQWIPEHWDEVLMTITGLILAIPGAIIGLQALLVPKAIELIQGFIDGLDINWEQVGIFFALLPGRILAQIPDLTETLKDKGSELFAGLDTGMHSKWAEIRDWLSTRHEQAGTAIGDLSETLLDHGVALLQGLWSGAEEKWVSFTVWVENIPSEILAYIGDLSGLLYGVGYSVVEGMANGLMAGVGLIQSAVDYLVSQIPGPVKTLLGIASPSKVMRDMMYAVPQGMALGIEDGSALVRRAMANVAGQSVAPLSPAFAPRVAGGRGGGAVYNLDLRGALIGRGAEAEIMRIVERSGSAVVDRRVNANALAGARR